MLLYVYNRYGHSTQSIQLAPINSMLSMHRTTLDHAYLSTTAVDST